MSHILKGVMWIGITKQFILKYTSDIALKMPSSPYRFFIEIFIVGMNFSKLLSLHCKLHHLHGANCEECLDGETIFFDVVLFTFPELTAGPLYNSEHNIR